MTIRPGGVADGLLFYLPFEALTLPGTHAFFGERYQVVRAASGSVLAAQRARPGRWRDGSFVGFGDPTLDGAQGDDDNETVIGSSAGSAPSNGA